MWSSFVTCLGLAFSRYIERKNAQAAQPRLYTCNVGQSGVSRKSTGARISTNVLNQISINGGVYLLNGFGSSEGLLAQLSGMPGTPLLNYLDELELVFKKVCIAGTSGVTPLHELYDCNIYTHPLRNGGITVQDAYLALLANSTPERFANLWESETVDNGFLSRWMLVAGAPSVRIPDPPPPDPIALQNFLSNLTTLLTGIMSKAGANKIPVGFAGGAAQSAWEGYYVNEIDPADPIYNRIDSIGERLMMILALAQNRYDIDAVTVQATIQFLRYEVQVRRILCPVVANNPVAALQQRILAKLPNPGDVMTRREIFRAIHAEREGTEIFDKALKGLVAEGMLKAAGTKFVRTV